MGHGGPGLRRGLFRERGPSLHLNGTNPEWEGERQVRHQVEVREKVRVPLPFQGRVAGKELRHPFRGQGHEGQWLRPGANPKPVPEWIRDRFRDGQAGELSLPSCHCEARQTNIQHEDSKTPRGKEKGIGAGMAKRVMCFPAFSFSLSPLLNLESL